MLDRDLLLVWKRGVRRGLLTLQREHEWATTLGVLIGATFLFQMMLVMMLGVGGIQSLLQTRTDIRLEILEGAGNQQVGSFFSVLKQQEYVEDAAYITKEQAYERAKQFDPELVGFLEEFNMGNPFPDTIGVTLHSLDDYDKFRTFAEQDQWKGIVNPAFLSEVTDQEQQVEELVRFTHAGRSLTVLILCLVATVLLFMTTELVRRRVLGRSDEVLVEKLVGASPMAMFIPFATEACILLFVANLTSIVLSIILLLALPTLVPALQAGGALAALRAEILPLLTLYLPLLFLLQLLMVPLLAAGGTWFGMRRELMARTLSLHRL